jgi:hypothetical protein
VIKLLIGVLFLVMAAGQWRRHTSPDTLSSAPNVIC